MMEIGEGEQSLPRSVLPRLHRELAVWFETYARDLPWRSTNNPYHIWLSEVILQQTQVVQGLDYYHRFLEAFPTIVDLAKAQEDEVLRLWQGLGYYSRGRNLLRAARMVVEGYEGQIPSSLSELKRLPGVGPYTQAAVLSFAYNLPYAAVDGNVYRVLSRLYALATPIDTGRGRRVFQQLADELLDREYPGRHNQAMIELGALCCTPRNPSCEVCPLRAYCLAYASGEPMRYPVKQGRVKVLERYLYYILVLLPGGQMLVRRRGAGDIWQGLYELPLVETDTRTTLEELVEGEPYRVLLSSLVNAKMQPIAPLEQKHRLTHRLLYATLLVVHAEGYVPIDNQDFQLIELANRGDYGMPILLDKMLTAYEHQYTTRYE